MELTTILSTTSKPISDTVTQRNYAMDTAISPLPAFTDVDAVIQYLFEGMLSAEELGQALPSELTGLSVERLKHLAKEQANMLRPRQLQALFEGCTMAEVLKIKNVDLETSLQANVTSMTEEKEKATIVKRTAGNGTEEDLEATAGSHRNSLKTSGEGDISSVAPSESEKSMERRASKADLLREELLRQQALASLRRWSIEKTSANSTKLKSNGKPEATAGMVRAVPENKQDSKAVGNTASLSSPGREPSAAPTVASKQSKERLDRAQSLADYSKPSKNEAIEDNGIVGEHRDSSATSTKMIQVTKKDGEVVTVSMKVHIPEAAVKRARERQLALQAKRQKASSDNKIEKQNKN